MTFPPSAAGLRLLGAAALALGLASAPDHAEACQEESYVGSICIVAFTYCPRGTVEAWGEELAIAAESSLFSLYGTIYGGDGRVNFGVPDLRGTQIVGTGVATKEVSATTLGQYQGWETYTLSYTQMPAHSHSIDLSKFESTSTLTGTADNANSVDPKDSLFAISQASNAYAATSNTSMGDGLIDEVTANYDQTFTKPTPINNATAFSKLGPQLGLRMCVVVDGDYPPRP